MLAGRDSFDVELAVVLGRALQLPAELVMQMQLRYDFSQARLRHRTRDVALWNRPPRDTFPPQHLTGRLGRAGDTTADDLSIFFQEDAPPGHTAGGRYAGLHALWRGDRLRVYDDGATVCWTGPVLRNLDGRPLLPGVRPADWREWFRAGLRADLALGDEHRNFVESSDRE